MEDEVIEEIGYVLSATIGFNGSSAGDTMITIGGSIGSSTGVSAVASPLVGVSEAEILTSAELAVALEQDALFVEYIKKTRETNLDNYDWWVKYVEDDTSSRIEALDIP